jgi:hypothetical protein
MSLLIDLRQRAAARVLVPVGRRQVACGRSLARLFGAVGPTQPDQAVLAKAREAVQAPSSTETAAVADACPVAAFQFAQRSDRERDRAGADANGKRVWSSLFGPRKAGLQRRILCGSGIEVGSEDLGDEDDRRAADREEQFIEAS